MYLYKLFYKYIGFLLFGNYIINLKIIIIYFIINIIILNILIIYNIFIELN